MKLRRRKHILWDYNGDGQFFKEKFGGFWKNYWNRVHRRRERGEISDEIGQLSVR